MSGAARPDRLARRGRGGGHRPGLPARRPRRLRAAHLPRVHRRLGGDHPLGEVARAGGSPPRSPRTTCCSPTTWRPATTRSTRSTRRCAPPADVAALREALADGTIDCVATDHAPHPVEDKETEWAAAAFGMTGLETALRVVQEAMVDTGLLGLGRRGRPDVGPARRHRPAARPRAAAGRRARRRTWSCTTLRPARSVDPARTPRAAGTRRSRAWSCPAGWWPRSCAGRPTVLDGKLA